MNSDTRVGFVPVRVPDKRKRKNLVIVAGGDTSLHTKWIQDLTDAERNWDLALTYFGDSELSDDVSDLIVRQKGFKYDCVARMLEVWPWIYDYDYVWLCDEDIQTSWSDIQRRFALMEEYQLDLAQPALSAASSNAIYMTMVHPEYILRYTNDVDVMAPIFSRAAFKLCAPTFASSPTGHWLDWTWVAMMGNPRNKVAVLDAVPVDHFREYGRKSSIAWGYVRDHGKNLKDTVTALIRPYGFEGDLIKDVGFYEYGYVPKNPITEDPVLKLTPPPVARQLVPRLKRTLRQAFRQGITPAWQGSPVVRFGHIDLGEKPQTADIPRLDSENWCISAALTFNIKSASLRNMIPGRAYNLLFFGRDSHHTPLGIQLMLQHTPSGQPQLTMNYKLCGKSLFQTDIHFVGVPCDTDLRIGLQIYPQAGWICTWINGIPAKDYWSEPFSFDAINTVRIGNDKLMGKLDNIWVSSLPVSETSPSRT